MRGFLARLWRMVNRVNTFSCFIYPDDGPRDMPAVPRGYTLQIYDALGEVPAKVASIAMPRRPFDLMRIRMRRGLARLMVLFDANAGVAAYGWLQSWRPFRRRFACIASRGAMLGFYWTRPDQRGRGLYLHLLRLSMALAAPREPLIIYACVANTASLAGISKAGFKPLARLQLRRVLWFLHFTTMLPEPPEPATLDGSLVTTPAIAGRIRPAPTTLAGARKISSSRSGTSPNS